MNDHEAMEAINAVLERFFRGRLRVDPWSALNEIARISGENKIEHNEVKESK